jgi:diadenosine tetraphosphatase ApaH/serine/threonine PP2A family protein phosphatase
MLIVSDIHANLVALEAVLEDCGEFDALWNLGDTVGYGPRPSECLERVRGLGADPMLAGNHDLASIGLLDDHDFNAVARTAARWTAGALNAEQKRVLGAFPSEATRDGFTLAHGSPRNPVWEYIASPLAAEENASFFSTSVCFVGHTHVASCFALDAEGNCSGMDLLNDGSAIDLATSRFIINPGSVGQPRDRDPRAAYGLLDTAQGVFTGRRVAYDVQKTQRQMEAAELPEILIKRLAFGR